MKCQNKEIDFYEIKNTPEFQTVVTRFIAELVEINPPLLTPEEGFLALCAAFPVVRSINKPPHPMYYRNSSK